LLNNPWRHALIIVFSGIAGFLINHTFAGLFAGTLLCLIWHLVHLQLLLRWLQRDFAPPFPPMQDRVWLHIRQTLLQWRDREQKRKRKHKPKRIFQQFLDAIAALPDGVILLNRGKQVEWCNQAAKDFLGLAVEKDIGLPIGTLIRQPAFVEFLNRWRADEKVEIGSPLNPEQWLCLRLVNFGKKRHLLLVTDVSETRRVERMRRDFVANASHELRTPLTVFTGYLETLLDNDMPENVSGRWQKPLQQMQEQSSRMLRIIENLLFLSRLENDATPVSKPLPVAKMLAVIVADARTLSGDKQHDIHLTADADLWLSGSEQELSSAFSNLIFNAVKHTPAGTRIEVRWFSNTQAIYLQVEDNGSGIAPQHLPRLSERFYRVDRSRQSSKDGNMAGTGLGLAIAKHVVQRHHGILHIDSQVGIGSVFSCQFSLQQQAQTKSSDVSAKTTVLS
jgi:two-component system phosphate regulon sensor histidine kinase PhoR